MGFSTDYGSIPITVSAAPAAVQQTDQKTQCMSTAAKVGLAVLGILFVAGVAASTAGLGLIPFIPVAAGTILALGLTFGGGSLALVSLGSLTGIAIASCLSTRKAEAEKDVGTGRATNFLPKAGQSPLPFDDDAEVVIPRRSRRSRRSRRRARGNQGAATTHSLAPQVQPRAAASAAAAAMPGLFDDDSSLPSVPDVTVYDLAQVIAEGEEERVTDRSAEFVSYQTRAADVSGEQIQLYDRLAPDMDLKHMPYQVDIGLDSYSESLFDEDGAHGGRVVSALLSQEIAGMTTQQKADYLVPVLHALVQGFKPYGPEYTMECIGKGVIPRSPTARDVQIFIDPDTAEVTLHASIHTPLVESPSDPSQLTRPDLPLKGGRVDIVKLTISRNGDGSSRVEQSIRSGESID